MPEAKSWKPVISDARQTTLANSLLWDVIGQVGWKIPVKVSADIMGRPTEHGTKRITVQHLVVKFQGHYYAADGNPWPRDNRVTTLRGKRGSPHGDLYITAVGAVSTVYGSRVVGVQDDVEPVAAPVGKAASECRMMPTNAMC